MAEKTLTKEDSPIVIKKVEAIPDTSRAYPELNIIFEELKKKEAGVYEIKSGNIRLSTLSSGLHARMKMDRLDWKISIRSKTGAIYVDTRPNNSTE